MKPRIAVIGSDGPLAPKIEHAAEQVGKDIAKNDCILVCGGRGGVMEAACRGAKSAGGLTVGILPSQDIGEANPHLDFAVTTGFGYARNALVVSSSEAVVAISGSIGTLSEIALALNYGKPVILVEGTGGVADSVTDDLFEGRPATVVRVRYPEAVEKALALIG